MDKHGFWHNKKITFYWVGSYALVIVLSIVLNYLTYTQIDKKVSEQNDSYMLEVLENKKNRLDGTRRTTANCALEISHNEDIRAIAFLESDSVYGATYQYVIDAKNYINTLKYIHQGMNDIYVYFPKSEFYVGWSVSNNRETFYNVAIKEKGIAEDVWNKLVNDNYTGNFIIPESTTGEVYYMLSLYGSERFVPIANIIIELPREQIIPDREGKGFNQDFYILNKDNSIFASVSDEKIKQVEKLISENAIENGINHIDGETIIVLDSADKEWRYAYVIENSAYGEIVNFGRIMTLVYSVLCLVLGLLMAMWMAKQNYKPVKRILAIFNGANAEFGNEFKYIESKITDAIEKNNSYGEMTKQLKKVSVKDALLSRVVVGDLPMLRRNEILDSLEYFDINFLYENFAVVLFYIDITSEMFFDNDENTSFEENYDLAQVVFTNVLEELLGSEFKLYYCNINGMICCVINSKKKEMPDIIQEKIRWMAKFVQENFNISFSAGISDCCTSLEALGECYNHAKICINQRYYKYNDAVKYEEIEENSRRECYIDENSETKLREFLSCGNMESCHRTVDEIFKNQVVHSDSMETAKCILYSLCSVVARSFSDSGHNEKNRMQKLLMRLGNTGAEMDIDSIKNELDELIEIACSENAKKTVNGLDSTLLDIKAYIEENYKNINLSGAMIAEKFDISISYLSLSFKKKFHIGLLEFLRNIRIDAAKKLLVETDHTMDEVASMAGFSSTRTFFRSFDKCMNCTPSKYRSMYK